MISSVLPERKNLVVKTDERNGLVAIMHNDKLKCNLENSMNQIKH